MIKGIAASNGYAIGHVVIKENFEYVGSNKKAEDKNFELTKLKEAVKKSRGQLEKIKEKALKEVGKDKAEVFEAHMVLLEDPEFIGAIEMEIENNSVLVEDAVKGVMDNFVSIFESMDDEYMRERASDIKDVSMRLIKNSLGKNSESMDEIDNNSVIVAVDLTPSDTAELPKDKVLAFVTNMGGRTSHSAIMARTLEIPAVVGTGDIVSKVKNKDEIIVDGVNGIIIVNPSNEEKREYEEKIEKFKAEKEELKKLKDVKVFDKNGKHIEIVGNIGKPNDINGVLQNGGEGVGLFRTEFLYMDRNTMPSEEEQFEAYKTVLEKAEGKPIVIRTLDIGGDKKLPYLDMPEECNPFLGYRAIRLCLDRKDIFRIQLRALLRASVYGNLKIMFPMISSIDEFLDAKSFLNECKAELIKEGKPVNDSIEVGIMVEIPSAAVMADEFAKYVDFFSIGTNDLIQYTLAADRMNEKISYLYNPMHPAVLKLIKMTIDGAHSQGKWCGMCGEMAGDENAIETLVNFGLDEFSMSASSILKAKEIILNMNKHDDN